MARSSLKNILKMVNNDDAGSQFINDLNFSIVKQDKLRMRAPSQSFKPSSMNCVRNMYFQVTGKEPVKDVPPSLIGIMESGTDRHERIQRSITDMKESGIDCEFIDVSDYVKEKKLNIKIIDKKEYETKLYNTELNISFLCDGIVKYRGKYYILEIKTETSSKYWKHTGVREEHIEQATTYSICLGINDILFLYECRDFCDKKAFHLIITDEMKGSVISKINEVNSAIQEERIPEEPYKKDINFNRDYCRYCNYKYLCRRN